MKLVDVPDTFIEDYSVQLEKGSHNRIAGWVRLNGARKQQPVTVRIPEAGHHETRDPGRQRLRAVRCATPSCRSGRRRAPSCTTSRWRRPRRPGADRIGFRTIQASGTKILLNGKPHLRGVSMHAEAPIRAGRLFSEADARTLLGWAKETGCNFVRLAHYPHDEVMTRLADQMGLLVWSEVPVYWTIAWENPETLAQAPNSS